MEKKLKDYRAKQEKVNKIQLIQKKFSQIFQRRTNVSDKNQVKSNNKPEGPIPVTKSLHSRKRKMDISEVKSLIPDDTLSEEGDSSLDDSIWCCSWLKFLYFILYFILWGTVYVIFIKLQFGLVYLMLSTLIFIYFNTGTKPRKSEEMSAYSVFNKDCLSIDGTLKAEQFEKEIMFGAGAII